MVSYLQTGLRHLESDHTLKDKCFGDADTLSSGSSELEDLSSRDKILPNKGNFFSV